MAGTTNGGSIQAVQFAFEILEYVARCQTSVGVTEMARAFDTTKSRIHRHLQTLVAAGYLVRSDETERYSISARLVALGHAVSESFELATAARDIIRELRDAVGHAVSISQPEVGGNRILAIMPSRSNFDIHVKPGSLLSYSTSAQGKITLAFGDPLLLSKVIVQGLERATPYSIVTEELFIREIAAIRERRWATAPNQSMVGLNALAVPIFNALGGYAGALAITDSIHNLHEIPTTEQVVALQSAAEKISANLGYRDRDKETSVKNSM